MVWPFSPSSGASSQPKPGRDLDPSLEEFLKQQGPVKYEPEAQSRAQPPSAIPSTASPPLPPATSQSQDVTSTQQSSTTASRPPNRSLFSDGRYDHLWATYRPLSEVEASSKSDAEKMDDVLQSYKARKTRVQSAALENCAFESLAQEDCFRAGSWSQRMSMCRTETRSFERCYTMQTRFLRALGYLGDGGRPPEAEEELQLHADDLYRRMLEQERLSEEARKAGRPEPVFAPILAGLESKAQGARAVPIEAAGTAGLVAAAEKEDEVVLPREIAELKPKVQEKYKERLKGLSGLERELEGRAIVNEIKAGQVTGRQYEEMQLEAKRRRDERRHAGQATLGDRIQGIFGW